MGWFLFLALAAIMASRSGHVRAAHDATAHLFIRSDGLALGDPGLWPRAAEQTVEAGYSELIITRGFNSGAFQRS